MSDTQNAQENVSAAKGVQGGYVFRAPLGTTLPTSPQWTPDNAWVCMGYASEDGVSFSTETDSEDFKDMNGDTIANSSTSHDETFVVRLVEIKRAVMETLYGKDQVQDENGVLTVHINGADTEYYSYVFMFLLRDGRKWIRVAESAKVTELDDLTAVVSDIAARQATFKALKGSTSGDYYTDYFDSTETEAAGA